MEELTRLLREAEQRAETAEQRAETAEKQIQLTTLDEYITACHSLVSSKFKVELNKALTSKGAITNPRDKWCPTYLRPWPDFIQQQRVAFGTLYNAFPADNRVFENRTFLAGLGERISKRKIADEKSLEYFLHNSVEDPVKFIIDQMKEVEEVHKAFHLGNGIVFENHPHAISDVDEEVLEREAMEAPSTPPSVPSQQLDLNQLRPDQICVYRSDKEDPTKRTMIYISEYKPPHKLTAPHLRLGLRPMNIHQDVVNRKTIPTSVDADARFQYHADRLTAAAITQTYHYMIEGGLEYGLLTTGEAIVFLKIDWQEPGTLLYHLAEPDAEVLAHPSYFHLCTAVGQYLAFSLMAIGLPGEGRWHDQDERWEAMENLKTWAEDFNSALRSIPENERRAPDSSPGFKPNSYSDFDRSPYFIRRRRQRVGDDVVTEQAQRDLGESSDDEPRRHMPDTPSPAERRKHEGGSEGQGSQGPRRSQRILAQRPRGGREGQGGGRRNGEQDRPYCTQKCLLGLVNGGSLDPGCPNMVSHMKKSEDQRSSSRTCTRHTIDHTEFLDLLWDQLQRSLDDGITPLGQGGARGVLFKVTLLVYGYTFVSKGTIRVFTKDLEHEAAVYKRLQPVQGMHVPVFLGCIDLRAMNRIYYYDHRVYVVFMMFMSWGGDKLEPTLIVGAAEDRLQGEAMRSLSVLHQLGVVHKDVRWENMLSNGETNGVMMIDFERALLVKSPCRPLARVGPNKRRRKPEAVEKPSGLGQVSGDISEDIARMKMAFSARIRNC